MPFLGPLLPLERELEGAVATSSPVTLSAVCTPLFLSVYLLWRCPIAQLLFAPSVEVFSLSRGGQGPEPFRMGGCTSLQSR